METNTVLNEWTSETAARFTDEQRADLLRGGIVDIKLPAGSISYGLVWRDERQMLESWERKQTA